MDPQTQGGKKPGVNLNPIPRNMVAYIGGMNADERYYVLWKDYQMIVIQAEPLVTWEEVHKPKHTHDPKKVYYIARYGEWLLGLQYIHNLLHTIEFGRTNWAYLVPRPDGGYKIVQRQKRLRKIRCPTWAPLIEEKDITYTTWWPNEVRGGHWRGQEVEVTVGRDDFFLETLELIMFAHLLLHGLDLTYKVLAHIVEDGSVVGLVTEPELGRLVQYRDRGLVYDAISRIQRRGLIYPGIMNPNLHILNGKVRLSNLAGLRHYKDPAEVEELAASKHWEVLEEFFGFMDPNDFTPRPTWQRRWEQVPQLIPPQPSPEPPLGLQTFYFPISKDPNKLWWKPNCDSNDQDGDFDDRKRRANRRDQRNRKVVISLQLPEEMLQAIRDVPRPVSRHVSRLLPYSSAPTTIPGRKVSTSLLIRPTVRDRV
ncbi:hypothetical protein Hypma_001080 [Hypsizygus marmoreus]|uniref:Uncharacterized protein n=1 Tax=Hypsizygus marmoreus TaxID=39966 RepID=A0A369J6D4_HYPMA|nr:hypothetical protein Hypma_001080 [Hypsizygus marmoreus]